MNVQHIHRQENPIPKVNAEQAIIATCPSRLCLKLNQLPDGIQAGDQVECTSCGDPFIIEDIYKL